MQERTDRPTVLDRKGCPASRAGTRPPAAPPAVGTASVWSSASKRRLTGPSRQGLLVRERPEEGGRRGVNLHLAPSPYRAFGEAGRSHHGPNRSCATGHRKAGPQDVAPQADKREDRCESPERQSVKRPPVSISHSGVVVSGSAGARGEARCVWGPQKTERDDGQHLRRQRAARSPTVTSWPPSCSSSRSQRRASRARIPVGLGCSLVYFRNQSRNSGRSKDATARPNRDFR